MTDTVKIKITPNAVSASTEDQPDVAKLSFVNHGMLFVNDRKVIAESQYLQFDEGQGIVRVDKVDVQVLVFRDRFPVIHEKRLRGFNAIICEG